MWAKHHIHHHHHQNVVLITNCFVSCSHSFSLSLSLSLRISVHLFPISIFEMRNERMWRRCYSDCGVNICRTTQISWFRCIRCILQHSDSAQIQLQSLAALWTFFRQYSGSASPKRNASTKIMGTAVESRALLVRRWVICIRLITFAYNEKYSYIVQFNAPHANGNKSDWRNNSRAQN